MMHGPKLYRGTDGVMRTLTETAAHLGITIAELKACWFGTAITTQPIEHERAYYDAVRRNDKRRDR